MKLISGSISTCLPVVIRLNCDRPNLCFRSAMLDLERKCGELTGSIALQNARKAIDIRRQLPSTSDLGALAELLAGFHPLSSRFQHCSVPLYCQIGNKDPELCLLVRVREQGTKSTPAVRK
jgi:hypothetical protein